MTAAVKKFFEIKEEIGNKYYLNENEMNRFGYSLINENKINEAIEIFKMNVALFPESWNVFDSLGEGYAKAGQKELAIENYEKSLKLNSKNTSAVEALKKLKEK
jgi:serine-type D-Ala-D-Ala carboxypeptidase/endopeptidase